MIRSFIAIPIVATTEISKVQKWLSSQGGGIRVISPEQLHLTLCFVGETSWELITRIGDIIEETLSGKEALTAHLGPIGAFPNLSQPRVIWADISPKEPLTELHQALSNKLDDLGLNMEQRTYIPHVTLARVKGELASDFGTQLQQIAPLHLGTVQLDTVTFFESQPGRQGPEYHVLSEHFL